MKHDLAIAKLQLSITLSIIFKNKFCVSIQLIKFKKIKHD